MFDEPIASELIDGMVCKGSTVRAPPLPGDRDLYAQRLIAHNLAALKALKASPTAVAGIAALIVCGACCFLPLASA